MTYIEHTLFQALCMAHMDRCILSQLEYVSELRFQYLLENLYQDTVTQKTVLASFHLFIFLHPESAQRDKNCKVICWAGKKINQKSVPLNCKATQWRKNQNHKTTQTWKSNINLLILLIRNELWQNYIQDFFWKALDQLL